MLSDVPEDHATGVADDVVRTFAVLQFVDAVREKFLPAKNCCADEARAGVDAQDNRVIYGRADSVEIKCPPEGLLGSDPLRTAFESVALGKAEALGTSGLPAAGGRVRRLVMKRQRDRVEHVLPVLLLPAPILRQVHAQRGEPVRNGDGDLGLLGLAVAGDRGPDAFR